MSRSAMVVLCLRAGMFVTSLVLTVRADPPTILQSDPFDGAIDAGQLGGGVRNRWDALVLSFDGDANAISAADFSISASDGLAPNVISFVPSGNTGTLNLDDAIPVGVWTTITFEPTGASIRLGHLPGDVNGDGYVGPLDGMALIDALNGVQTGLPLWATDVDRSGAFDADDAAAFEFVLSGTESDEPWNGASLPGENEKGPPQNAGVSKVVFELVPAAPGPYFPGSSVGVEVWLHSQVAHNVRFRMIQLDTVDTHSSLVLNGPDVWPVSPNGIEEFTFDYSSVAIDIYSDYPDYPVPATYYFGGSASPFMLMLPAGGSLRAGFIQSVTLPMTPGNYTLDVMNSDSFDPNYGAILYSGFGVIPGDSVMIWRSDAGELTGGTYTFVVSECVPLCDDGNPCTDDVCLSGGVCDYPANDANDPEDGLFCNGDEDHCSGGVIVYSTPALNCDDGLDCTQDACNEAGQSCDHLIASDSCLIEGACIQQGTINPANDCYVCDSAQHQTLWSLRPAGATCGGPPVGDCDAQDTCSANGECVDNLAADGIPCGSDGLECTFDSCQSGTCVHPPKPMGTACGSASSSACDLADSCDGQGDCSLNFVANGTSCPNGLYCDGEESCMDGVCQSGAPPDCDDGNFCNGFETCDPVAGCIPGTPPCGVDQFCDNDADQCLALAIPTVSSWGLLILGLGLSVCAKLRFRTRWY